MIKDFDNKSNKKKNNCESNNEKDNCESNREYFVLLYRHQFTDKLEILGKKNKRKTCYKDNTCELFEGLNKNNLFHGWTNKGKILPYFKNAKVKYPEAIIISLDVFSKNGKLKVE